MHVYLWYVLILSVYDIYIETYFLLDFTSPNIRWFNIYCLFKWTRHTTKYNWKILFRTNKTLNCSRIELDPWLVFTLLSFSDFISVELFEGKVQVLADFGSGTVNLTTSPRVNDGSWHRLDILWGDEVRVCTLKYKCIYLFTHGKQPTYKGTILSYDN